MELPAVLVRRMRVHTADPLGASRAAAIWRSADLSVSAVPERAILVVRRFGRGLPPVSASRWQDSARAQLTAYARIAARPAKGPPPDGANAIWFDDMAELLACLAADWLAGRLDSAWWWKTLFISINPSRPQFWVEHVHHLPAMFERLAAMKLMPAFANAFGGDTAGAVVRVLVREFAASNLTRVLDAACFVTSARDIAIPGTIRVAPAVSPPLPINRFVMQPSPHAAWVPEADETFWSATPLQAALLATVALLLRRAPHIARQAAFAARLDLWIRSRQLATPAQLPAPSVARTVEAAAPEPSTPAFLECALSTETSTPQPRDAESPSNKADPVSHPIPDLPSTTHSITQDHTHLLPPPQAEDRATMAPAPSPQCASQRTSQTVEAFEIETSYGGAFFLVNLGVALGFYPDFSNPLGECLSLPLWDFVFLTALAILDDAGEHGSLNEDPIWSLLNVLAGHADESPEPPDESTQLAIQQAIHALADLKQLLIVHDARIAVTASHIDAFFAMERHPVDIRMSGLDRDPGWLPAGGRYLAFHFE